MKATIASPALFDDALTWAVLAYPDEEHAAPVSVTADADSGEVRITGLDAAHAHTASVAADVLASGQAWIDGTAAQRLFKNVGAGAVWLQITDGVVPTLSVRTTNVRGELSTEIAPGHTDYPGPEVEWITHGQIQGDLFATTATAAARFAELGTLFAVYGGVRLTSQGSTLIATAGSKHTMATFNAAYEAAGVDALDVVVPAVELGRAARGMLFTGFPVTIATAPGRRAPWVRLTTPGRVAHIRTIDQRWPLTPAPPGPVATAEIPTLDLLHAVGRLESRDPGQAIDIHLGEHSLVLAATSRSGAARVELPWPRRGAAVGGVRVSSRLLRRALTNVLGVLDLLDVSVSGPHAPLVITAAGDDTSLVQIQSIRPAGSVRGV